MGASKSLYALRDTKRRDTKRRDRLEIAAIEYVTCRKAYNAAHDAYLASPGVDTWRARNVAFYARREALESLGDAAEALEGG